MFGLVQTNEKTKILRMTKEEFKARQLNTSIVSMHTTGSGATVALCISNSELVYVIIE